MERVVPKPNRQFGHRSTLDYMLSGRVEDLEDIGSYLDKWSEEN